MPRRPSTTRIERSLCSPDFEIRRPSRSSPRRPHAPLRRRRRGRAKRWSARARQQQRLVADLGRAMARRIDLHRAGERAAIAAAQHERPAPGGVRIRATAIAVGVLPAPPSVEIADADHRNTGGARPAAPSATPPPRHRRQPAATAGRTSGRPDATRRPAHALSALAVWPRAAPDRTASDKDRAPRRCVQRAGQRAPSPGARSARPLSAPRHP